MYIHQSHHAPKDEGLFTGHYMERGTHAYGILSCMHGRIFYGDQNWGSIVPNTAKPNLT